MNGGILNEALERFHRTGPEWGESQLTNHGPMAVEVLVRRGRTDEVHRWADRYLRRLDIMPTGVAAITEETWPEALGDGRRVGDWTQYFTRQLAERPWRDVLATWWPRLLPGILAGTTHGVIRVGHAARAMLAGAESAATVAELAHGLAFWAARSRGVPVTEPAGGLTAAVALDGLPRIARQEGTVAARLSQLADLPQWPASVASLRSPAAAEDVPDLLADVITAATLHYSRTGHASPVLLVHTATAPNAVLHTLPALPREVWMPSLSAIWTVVAAVVSAYAPARLAQRPYPPRRQAGADPVADVLDRAVDHGDEHVIKFTDTAVEVYTRTGNPDALAAATHIMTLIDPVAD
jgi:hypothetical protein